jgi:acyl-CoA thioesterase FadM
MTSVGASPAKPVVDVSAFRDWQYVEPQDHQYSGGHLTALAADELFFNARGVYFGSSIGWPGIGSDFWMIYRRLEMDYLAEAFVGEALRTGTRAVGRSQRSVRLEQVLQTVDGPRTIAVGRLVVVAFDVLRREPVAVPDEMWQAIEAFERPMTESA